MKPNRRLSAPQNKIQAERIRKANSDTGYQAKMQDHNLRNKITTPVKHIKKRGTEHNPELQTLPTQPTDPRARRLLKAAQILKSRQQGLSPQIPTQRAEYYRIAEQIHSIREKITEILTQKPASSSNENEKK